MRLRRDREPEAVLEQRLRELPMDDEDGAEDRGWEVVRTAHAARTPFRPSRRTRRLSLAVAGGVLAIAVGLSPAGARVSDLVSDVVGVDSEETKPELRSLPASGELLVESEQGVWLVRQDGSKRLLGDYREATWSPRGLNVAAADGRRVVALDPAGNVAWTGPPAAGAVRDLRWAPSGVRIAYRSGNDLRVIGGDGIGDRLIAENVAPAAPVWMLPPGTKVSASRVGELPNVLAYLDREGRAQVVDADTGTAIDPGPADRARIRALETGYAISPTDGRLAHIERREGRSSLVITRGGERQRLSLGPGRVTDPVWSPDGSWLLVGWRDADQWLFINPRHPRRPIAIDAISSQFHPGGSGDPRFPRVAGWVLPLR